MLVHQILPEIVDRREIHHVERQDAQEGEEENCVESRDHALQGLTPELSRTDLRHGGVVHVTAQAEPRSGLGLNELLGG
jgi:hypothetical protein